MSKRVLKKLEILDGEGGATINAHQLRCEMERLNPF